MMLRIKGWMDYRRTSMGGDLCVWHQVDYNKISPFKRDHTRKIVITVKIRKEEIRVGKVQKGAMREFIFVMPQKV